MSKLNANDIAYYGKPITSLNREELLAALLDLANIINACPVKGECAKLVETRRTIDKITTTKMETHERGSVISGTLSDGSLGL